MHLQSPLTAIKGIGPKKSKSFASLSLRTVESLFLHLPHRYEDRRVCQTFREGQDGIKGLFCAVVVNVTSTRVKGNQSMTKVEVDDGSQKATVVYMNIPYIANQFTRGEHYWFYGAPQIKGKLFSLFHPESRSVKDYPKGFGIVPIYPLTEGLTQSDLKRALEEAWYLLSQVDESLPSACFTYRKLMARSSALQTIHQPHDLEALKEARYRLIYEEFFHLQMALMLIKEKIGHQPKAMTYQHVTDLEFQSLFPFELTESQSRVIHEIYSDMDSSHCMNRLLQGDVGSGKTAVAMAAAYKCVVSGYQVAIIAPTEILAKQHFASFEKILSHYGKVSFLTGQIKNRQTVLEEIENGESCVIVGTHAVFQERVVFKNLKLVITDEQHRFGVGQRQLAADKGGEPLDVLVMSATPIPRTLSLILYGDLDISVINTYPIGRKPIKTHYIKPSKVQDLYKFMGERLALGEQAYVVAPLIEDSEFVDLVSVKELYDTLKPYFDEFGLEMLHGQLKSSEKEAIMQRFKLGQTKVLVATTVIEVGVDVPQATMMIVTHAERFGLSQLHQLRGRVGRSDLQSFCFLLASSPGEIAKKRLAVMVATQDGFEIANKDLELRGPGEIIGLKQHGVPEFKLADLVKHSSILSDAQQDALNYIKNEGRTIENSDYAKWLVRNLVL